MTPLFDISAIPKGQTVKEFYYPQLLDKLPAAKTIYSHDPINGDKIIRYLLLLYDRYSPLISGYPDVRRRKEQGARVAGFIAVTKKGEDQTLNGLFDLTVPEYIDVIIEISHIQRIREWDIIMVNEANFYECQRILLSPIAETGNDLLKGIDIKGKLRDQMEKIDQVLDKYYRLLFPEDETLSRTVQKRKAITPENMAAKL